MSCPFEFDNNYPDHMGYDDPMDHAIPVGSDYCDTFTYDPLYYHSKWKFDFIVVETALAYLFQRKKKQVWVPKRWCKKLHVTKKGKIRVYIWNNATLEFMKINS